MSDLTIKVTRERKHGSSYYFRAECLGIVCFDSFSEVIQALGSKVEDRYETLKKMRPEDLTEKASAEKALLIAVLG